MDIEIDPELLQAICEMISLEATGTLDHQCTDTAKQIIKRCDENLMRKLEIIRRVATGEDQIDVCGDTDALGWIADFIEKG